MDNKIKNLIGDIMKKGEKVAPVKSIKLKVKFDKPNTMAKNKKSILKKALKNVKDNEKDNGKEEGAAHEKTESKVVEDMEGMGGPKKYKNLGK